MNLLIWDFDGTLGYREGKWSGALLELLDADCPNHSITREALVPLLQTGFPWHSPDRSRPGLSAEVWWTALEPVFGSAFNTLGLEAREAERLAAKVRLHYADLSRWHLYPETLPVLEQLSDWGWTSVLLSNHVPELEKILDYLGLTPHLKKIFNSAVTGFEKPNPQAFYNVLDTLEPDTAWMIGDNPVADIAGALGVGLSAILVHKKDSCATYTCADLNEVENFFRERRV